MVRQIDFLGNYDAESVVAELRRIATVSGKQTVGTADVRNLGRVSLQTVRRRFGSLRTANEAAGLQPGAVRAWTNEEMLDVVLDVWNRTLKDSGRRPMMSDVRKYGLQPAACTIAARFGTWSQALLAANEIGERRELNLPVKAAAGRSGLSVRTRFMVFKRDLYQCQICRKMGVELEVDHIVPVALGGSNEPGNLQTLCVPCNRGKRDSLQ